MFSVFIVYFDVKCHYSVFESQKDIVRQNPLETSSEIGAKIHHLLQMWILSRLNVLVCDYFTKWGECGGCGG